MQTPHRAYDAALIVAFVGSALLFLVPQFFFIRQSLLPNVAPGVVLPLPPDPDGTAREIRAAIHERVGVQVAVVISDTAGRAWRVGQTDIAIGCAGLAPFESFAGRDEFPPTARPPQRPQPPRAA